MDRPTLTCKSILSQLVITWCVAGAWLSPVDAASAPAASIVMVDSSLLEEPQARPRVLLFTRLDCPVSQRYAVETARIAERFRGLVDTLTVYVEPKNRAREVEQHFADFPSSDNVVLDPQGELARALKIDVSSTVAVLDTSGALIYRGRIDDRYVRLGLRRSQPTQHDLVEVLSRLEKGAAVRFSQTQAVGCYLDAAEAADAANADVEPATEHDP